jgi:hypothetical protein
MTDAYLSIAAIANDSFMTERVRAAATQQAHLGAVPKIEEPGTWTITNRYLWASSPTWGEKWDYAVQTHPTTPDEPPYFPGKDPAVITDEDILATVQSLGA